MLRRIIIHPTLPIILLACGGVYATVMPLPADMIWWYLAGLGLVAAWALAASVRATGRTERYMAEIKELHQKSVRLHEKSISRLDLSLTKKPGDQVVIPDPASIELPARERTGWEKLKAFLRWFLWD